MGLFAFRDSLTLLMWHFEFLEIPKNLAGYGGSRRPYQEAKTAICQSETRQILVCVVEEEVKGQIVNIQWHDHSDQVDSWLQITKCLPPSSTLLLRNLPRSKIDVSAINCMDFIPVIGELTYYLIQETANVELPVMEELVRIPSSSCSISKTSASVTPIVPAEVTALASVNSTVPKSANSTKSKFS